MSYEKMPALASDEQRVPADARFVERKSGGARDRLLGRVEGTSMSARRLALATGALVLVLAVGAVSVSALPLGTAANPERIDLIARATAINNFVDVGPADVSPRDIYVFVDDVFLPSAPSVRVGQALGRCTVIDPATARFGCSITTSLPGGVVTTDGTLVNAPGAISTGPITGGTGKFRNARGEGVLDLGPPEGAAPGDAARDHTAIDTASRGCPIPLVNRA